MVFLITGPDTYRARQKLAELKTKFLREVDSSGLNMQTVKGTSLTMEAVRHHLQSQPFLARRRFIIFDNILSSKKPEVLQAIIQSLDREREQKEGEDNIAVFFEDEEPAAKNKLHSWLVKHALLFRFPLLGGRDLSVWAEEEFRRRGRKISAKALRKLISSAGGDLWRLAGEIQKIDAYLEKNDIVEERAVDLLIVESFDDNIFALTDAVLMGDLKKSAFLLTEHLEREASPQQLVALLEKQFRVLILLVQERIEQTPPTIPGIHPYMAKKLGALSKRYEAGHLKKIYTKLLGVDLDLKTSAGDAKTLLLNFLASSSSK